MSPENGPFHQITTRDVWMKLESLETAVTQAITRMESHTEKVADNTSRIKALEVKVYGIAAGLLAGIVALMSGLFG